MYLEMEKILISIYKKRNEFSFLFQFAALHTTPAFWMQCNIMHWEIIGNFSIHSVLGIIRHSFLYMSFLPMYIVLVIAIIIIEFDSMYLTQRQNQDYWNLFPS